MDFSLIKLQNDLSKQEASFEQNQKPRGRARTSCVKSKLEIIKPIKPEISDTES